MDYRKQLRNTLTAKADDSSMVAFALIGGLAVGAAVALLFAPKMGRELRADITHSGRKFGGTLWELMDNLKEKFGKGKDLEREIAHSQKLAEEVSPSLKKPKSDIKSLIHEAHSG